MRPSSPLTAPIGRTSLTGATYDHRRGSLGKLDGVSQSALIPAQATWLSSDASVTLSDRWTANVSYGTTFGVADSLAASELGGGLRYAIAAPLALTLDASHGLTRGSPRWVFSIGFGTAFTGISAVTPTAPLRRLTTMFVGGRTVTTTTTACR